MGTSSRPARFAVVLLGVVVLGIGTIAQAMAQAPSSPAIDLGLPDADVIGGGPTGGNPEAVASIEAQLPDLSSTYDQAVGAAALQYIVELVAAVPSLGWAFNALDTVSDCAVRHGIVAARAYVSRQRIAAGAIVVVSVNQLERIGPIAIQCLLEDIVSGGGPLDGFDPCVDIYWYNAASEAVPDVYYAILAGTDEQTCADIKAVHQALYVLNEF